MIPATQLRGQWHNIKLEAPYFFPALNLCPNFKSALAPVDSLCVDEEFCGRNVVDIAVTDLVCGPQSTCQSSISGISVGPLK